MYDETQDYVRIYDDDEIAWRYKNHISRKGNPFCDLKNYKWIDLSRFCIIAYDCIYPDKPDRRFKPWRWYKELHMTKVEKDYKKYEKSLNGVDRK